MILMIHYLDVWSVNCQKIVKTVDQCSLKSKMTSSIMTLLLKDDYFTLCLHIVCYIYSFVILNLGNILPTSLL